MADRLVLERPLDSIQVSAHRMRQELGDLDELVESIKRFGLLEPIVITPSGTLVLGLRRLEACRRAGVKVVKVTVNARVSSRLEQVLAERDENALHKPLTPRELASLYAELKAIESTEAAEREARTRFGAERGPDTPAHDGWGDSPHPSPPKQGKAREFAARALTGTDSSQVLERVLALETLAADESRPAGLRGEAQRAIEALDAGEPLNPHWLRVHAMDLADRVGRLSTDPQADEDARAVARRAAAAVNAETDPRVRIQLANAALAQLRPRSAGRGLPRQRGDLPGDSETIGSRPSGWEQIDERMRARLVGRRFMNEIDRAGRFWSGYEPHVVGPALTDGDWTTLASWATSVGEFVAAAAEARDTEAPPSRSAGA